MNDRRPDPIPESFAAYEEAAEFWDSHDTTNYPEAFRTLEVKSKLMARRFEIELDPEVAVALRQKAKEQGMSASNLASELLRERLALARES